MPSFEWPIELSPFAVRDAMIEWQVHVVFALATAMAVLGLAGDAP
ncbi:MAG: hypothetical protein ACLPSW_33970 [Roseiarcus sp.]